IGVCALQSDGVVLFWNTCLEDWTKIPREQILGTQITERFPHLARPIYTSRFQQIFQGGPPTIFSAQLHKYVIPAPLPQGRWRIQHTTVTSVPAFDGNGFYALLSIQDVTDLTNRVQEYRELRDRALTEVQERQRAEMELVEAREAALAAARIKSQFLANMSHEIRTPMNGVLGMAELLLKTHLTTQQQNFAQVISNSANHLLTIINDILDFSKLEAGEMRLQTIDFDLNDCIDTVIEVLSSQAEEKGLELAVSIDSQVNRKLQGDPIRLRQILLNLVSNAIKFTDVGEVVLAVTRGVGEGESGGVGEMTSLLFSVRDTGIGISVEGQQKLFQSFSQVDASSTRQYGGTGLGLTICKQIVEQMGGEISVKSEIGQGSTFWFTAQFLVQDINAITQPSVVEMNSEGINRIELKNHQINILIAEDNLVNQQVLLNQLENLGYRADFVVNGEQALAMLSQQNYDIVLMDCQMPVIDGYTATQELRRREGSNRHTVVIALTANAMPEDREKCLASGMDDYISKPINLSLLNALLQRWTGSRVEISGVEEIISTAEPSSLPVNLARLEEVTRGNKSRQQRLLEIFVENAQTDIQAIALAIPINDYSTLEQKAHRLKGSSANVGVTYISDLAAELEILLHNQTLSTAALLLDAMDSHLNKVQIFLQTHFSTESKD
ncbi:MAG: response regulator, partial [Nostocaceae cyanobacterium]|nr:response regulator [Nostocaceae cyanobacterium]